MSNPDVLCQLCLNPSKQCDLKGPNRRDSRKGHVYAEGTIVYGDFPYCANYQCYETSPEFAPIIEDVATVLGICIPRTGEYSLTISLELGLPLITETHHKTFNINIETIVGTGKKNRSTEQIKNLTDQLTNFVLEMIYDCDYRHMTELNRLRFEIHHP